MNTAHPPLWTAPQR